MGIPVFLSATNLDAPIIAAIMASICCNTKAQVNFYIIDGFLFHDSKKRIDGCKKYFNNFTTEFIRVNIEPWINKYPELSKFDRNVFTKYIMPTVRPD